MIFFAPYATKTIFFCPYGGTIKVEKKMKRAIPVFIAAMTTLAGCSMFIDCVDGNGDVQTEVRDAVPFTAIANETSFHVNYIRGNEFTITVEAESNVLPYIETEIRSGALEINTIRGTHCLNYTRHPVITVTAPLIDEIVNEGSGDFAGGPLSGTDVRIVSSGSGDITVEQVSGSEVSVVMSGSGDVITDEIAAVSMKATLSGSGDLTMSGLATTSRYVVTGSGSAFSRYFTSDYSTVTLSGSGSVYATVLDNLDAVISGSGNIYLVGDPEINLTRTGSGRIIPL